MTEYLHPVSRACQEPTDENLSNLNKSELVYVLAEVHDLTPPEDEDGEPIHPDDFNGGVTRDMLESLIDSGRDFSGEDSEDE